MKTLIITREQFQDLEDAYDDAMSDRNVLLLRSIKAEMVEWIEAAHTEALEMNDQIDITRVNAARVQSQFYGAYDYPRRRDIVEAAHAEALEINQCFDFNVQQVELAAKHQRAVLERLA